MAGKFSNPFGYITALAILIAGSSWTMREAHAQFANSELRAKIVDRTFVPPKSWGAEQIMYFSASGGGYTPARNYRGFGPNKPYYRVATFRWSIHGRGQYAQVCRTYNKKLNHCYGLSSLLAVKSYPGDHFKMGSFKVSPELEKLVNMRSGG